MALERVRDHPFVAAGLVAAGLCAAAASIEPRIDPRGWRPPDPPAPTGPLEPNRELAGLETVVSCAGPEDIAFDETGRLYTGTDDGTVVRTTEPVTSDTVDADVETFAHTGGRPLGMDFDGDDLLVCAGDAGLVSVGPDGRVTRLSTTADGREIAFADDLCVGEKVVYFTDATEHDIFQDELFELCDTGRLLAYHPETGETTVELGGLGFANGVCPHADGESLLVTETSRYRVRRHYVEGDREGETEVFAENLPGYPDNIETPGDGTYWTAVPTRRDATLDGLHRRPWLKRQIGKLPKPVVQQIEGDPYGLVVRLDGDGELVESLHDPSGGVFGITSATPRGESLYLGSLFGTRVCRYDLG